MSAESTAEYRPKRRRSPSYPGISLEEALQRARALMESEGPRALVPVNQILKAWGYSPGSGLGLVILAALKKYGLLTDEGTRSNRRGRLTPLALRILRDEREESAERDAEIRDAALRPTIHKELWEEFGPELPSDGTMQHVLRSREFTDKAADELIKVFRETVAFAQLGSSDSLSDEDGDYGTKIASHVDDREPPLAAPIAMPTQAVRSAPVAPGARSIASYPLPLSAGEIVTLQGAFPLTERSWEQLLRVLEVMKPGLVAPDSSED